MARQRRARRAYAQAMSLAWHAAAFQRAKRLPALTTVLRKITDDGQTAQLPRSQTAKEQQAVVKRQLAAFASLSHGM